MIYIYLFILFIFGISIEIFLDKVKIINLKEMQKLEVISLGMTLGLILYTLYMFFIAIININFSFYIIVPIIILDIITLIYILKKINVIKKYICAKKYFKKEYLITGCLLSIFSIYIIYLISCAKSNFLQYPDEYSAWALNAKNIFLGKNMKLFINSGFETYPQFLPLLYSGYYFFVGKIIENDIRVFSAIFIILSLINLIAVSKRLKLNINFIILLFNFILMKYTGIFELSTSIYADIPFMCLYFNSIIYLIEWLLSDKNSKELALISLVNTIGICWCKTDGKFLIFLNIFIILINYIFSEKMNIKRKKISTIILYCISIMILPITWKIYTSIEKFPTELVVGAGSKFEIHFEYIINLFTNMSKQFFENMPWLVLSILGFIGILFFVEKLNNQEKKYLINLFVVIVGNVSFLIVCYICVFGAEAMIAASFIRYMTRIILVQLIFSMLALKPILDNRLNLNQNIEK